MQVRSIDDVLSVGQKLQVKVMGHDGKGQLQVSHKALTAAPTGPDGDFGESLPPSGRPPFGRRSGDRPPRPERPKRVPQGA